MFVDINNTDVMVCFGGEALTPNFVPRTTIFNWDTTINQDLLLTVKDTISIDEDLIQECLDRKMYDLICSWVTDNSPSTADPAVSVSVTITGESIDGTYAVMVAHATSYNVYIISKGEAYTNTFFTYDGATTVTSIANQQVYQLAVSYWTLDLDKIEILTNTGTTAFDFYHNPSTEAESITFGGTGTADTTNQIISNLGIQTFSVYIPETSDLTAAANGAFIGDCYYKDDLIETTESQLFDDPNSSNSFVLTNTPLAGSELFVQSYFDVDEYEAEYCKGQIYFTNDYFTYDGNKTFTTSSTQPVEEIRVTYFRHQ